MKTDYIVTNPCNEEKVLKDIKRIIGNEVFMKLINNEEYGLHVSIEVKVANENEAKPLIDSSYICEHKCYDCSEEKE